MEEDPEVVVDAPATETGRPKRKRPRSLWRRITRVFKPIFVRPLLALGLFLGPRIYVAYMWFVWKTSKVDDAGIRQLQEWRKPQNGLVCILWHEEVFSVSWGYRELRPHTLASAGDAGELIARMLKLCGFVVFRGGSSGHSSRRNEHVLRDMIEHMKTTDDVLYGITVDGSRGPYHHLKRGAVVIARDCKKPIALLRTWAKRRWHLKTWDRMVVLPPFNHIKIYAEGPFDVPEGAKDPEVLEAFRLKMEQGLKDLAERSRRELG